jgi:hypothetical protein
MADRSRNEEKGRNKMSEREIRTGKIRNEKIGNKEWPRKINEMKEIEKEK